MIHPPTCRTADFFVLRCPSLPLGPLQGQGAPRPGTGTPDATGVDLERDREALREVLRGLAGRGEVREALALASPDLAARLEAWLEGTLDPAASRGMERALLKYLGRMSSRATPFGLFAGVSMGAWGAASQLSVKPWLEGRKVVRLDWGVLETLVDRLEQEPEVRGRAVYRPNSSLHACAGRYRYLEHRDEAGAGRTYHLEAAETTPHLDFALQQAGTGVRLEELAERLSSHLEVPPEEARSFLDRIVQAQVLGGGLHPPLTSPDPLGHVIAALQADPATARRAVPLLTLGRALDFMQRAPIGSHPGVGPEVGAGIDSDLTALLAGLGVPPETRDVLQVDLYRAAPGLALSPAVRRALEDGAETLRRLAPPPSAGPLDRFRAAFTERYGTRWVPLLEALDEESGIGFDGAPSHDSPLLEDLIFQSAPPAPALSPRDRFLLRQIPRWQGSPTWELEEADVEALAQPDPPPLPASFAALATLAAPSSAALDRGEFQFWMEHISGPTAARWLGRFASGDAGLEEALRSHLLKEEATRPEAVFAEVVHVPEGRMGNVLARPSLRSYEIPFLAVPGVAAAGTILPSDLQLTVRGDRVVLASLRLGREVVPRLSSAHNYTRGPAVYRFLARLQDQDGRPGGWSWGALGDQPFLPRVTRGRHVLSKARWRVEARELKEALADSGGEAWGAFQVLRTRRSLPRFVLLTDADNSLLVDLDQVLWVETLHQLVANRSGFILTECFPDPGQGLVTSSEGRFTHELVVPFEGTAPLRPKAVAFVPPGQVPEARVHPPGSEWLYLKLYCGPASADRLLVELGSLLRMTKSQGLWDRWHFIRYRDPDPHLRLRFHGRSFRLLAELLPLLHRHLQDYLAEGLLWKWQVDTFEPEWERYGGPLGFGLAEAWFFEDSEQVLNRLAVGLTQDGRWRAGLRNVDAIWAALGLDVEARMALATAVRDGLRREFGEAGPGTVKIGTLFRRLRKDLEEGLPHPIGDPRAPGAGRLARIREAFDRGLMPEDLASVAGSLAHMHLNRLLRTDHRENEWVLMEFLVRLYDSHLARGSERPVREASASR